MGLHEEERNNITYYISKRLSQDPNLILYVPEKELSFSNVDTLNPGEHIKFTCKYGKLDKVLHSKFVWKYPVSEDEEQLVSLTFDEYAKALEYIGSGNYKERVTNLGEK